MIKYKLNCKNCNNTFDSWFASSNEFEKLKKMRLISCDECHSLKIDKSIMSPRISSSINYKTEENSKKFREVKKKIKNFQNYIKRNFEYVGENFTYKARSIHYDKKKPKKGIYGSASLKDVKELREEGIETDIIPWIEDDKN